MDEKTKNLIQKFRQNREMAQQIMQSSDGQTLMSLLTKDGGQSLQEATQSAQQGDTAKLAKLLGNVMQTPQGADLMRRISEIAKK